MPERRHCRLDVDVVTRAPTLSPGCRRCRPGAHVAARTQKFSLRRRCCCPRADSCGLPTTPASGYRHCRPRRSRLCLNFAGYKRPKLPYSPHFASIRSFLAWTCPPATPYENLTDRTLAFLCYCVIVYMNCIGAPLITFMFYITSIDITCIASC